MIQKTKTIKNVLKYSINNFSFILTEILLEDFFIYLSLFNSLYLNGFFLVFFFLFGAG